MLVNNRDRAYHKEAGSKSSVGKKEVNLVWN